MTISFTSPTCVGINGKISYGARNSHEPAERRPIALAGDRNKPSLKQGILGLGEFGEEVGVCVFQLVERAEGKGGAVGDQIAWA